MLCEIKSRDLAKKLKKFMKFEKKIRKYVLHLDRELLPYLIIIHKSFLCSLFLPK